MRPVHLSALSSALSFLLAAVALPAQDSPLAVERRSDQRGHARAIAKLSKARLSLRAEEMSCHELCSLLTAATGSELTFQCAKTVSAEAPRLDFEVRSASALSLMTIAQIQSGLRFVYRFGVVFLVPAADVKPLTVLRVYDLRGACVPLRSFPGPDLRLRTPGDDRPLFPEEVETDATISGFTADGIEQLLRDTVQPESWDADRVRLINQNGMFLIRQTPAAHREIDELLVRVGLVAPRRPLVRRASSSRATSPSRVRVRETTRRAGASRRGSRR